MAVAYLKRKKAVPAFISSLLFGLCLGLYLWNIFFGYVPSNYEVKFDANWLAYPDNKVHESYFRQKINLENASQIRNAWLKVAAPDDFVVYVNGKKIDSASSDSTIVTNVYNITSALKDGVNVVAISNNITFNDRSGIRTEGYYEDFAGAKKSLISERNWKVLSYAPNLMGSPVQWFDIPFNDDGWKNAAPMVPAPPLSQNLISFDPSAITSFPKGEFAWADSAADRRFFLRYPLQIKDTTTVRDVWLRMLQEDGYNYNIVVNGTPVVRVSSIGSDKPISDQKNMGLYNITKYLHKGNNIIGLFVFSERSDSHVYIDGLVSSRNNTGEWFFPLNGGSFSSSLSEGWPAGKYDDSGWRRPVPLGRLLSVDMPQKIDEAPTTPTGGYVLLSFFFKYLFVFMTAIVVVALWFAISHFFSRLKGIAMEDALSIIGLLLFFLFLGLVLLYVLSFDIRLSPAFPYQRAFMFLTGGIFLAILMLSFLWRHKKPDVQTPDAPGRPFSLKDYVLVFALVTAGFLLRIYPIDFRSLNGDEATMYFYSQGVLENFYPNLTIMNSPPHRILTTSEIEPFFVATGIKLFGSNEFGIRFASTVFGTLTILLIYIAGKEIFGRRVAFLSCFLFAFMPLAINYAKFGRYPAEVQFFSLLSTYFFYKCISGEKISPLHAWGTAVTFILAYLSWEGAGFLLPSFLGALLLYKGKDFSWLKSKHLWLSIISVVVIVLWQLGLRYMYVNSSIQALGASLGGITIAPQWIQPAFAPFFYIQNYFLVDNMVTVSFLFGIGLLFFLKDRVLTVFYGIILISTCCMTFLLEIKDTRYLYYIMPLVVLCGFSVFFRLLDFFLSYRSQFTVFIGRPIQALAFLIIFLPSNDLLMKPYNNPVAAYQAFSKINMYDTKNTAGIEFLRSQIRPGDAVMSNWPHVFKVWLDRCDYFAANELTLPVIVRYDMPAAAHRITGSPLVKTLTQLKDVLAKEKRLWFIFSSLNIGYLDKDFIDYIKQNTRSVYEDTSMVVYLWDR